MEPLLKFPANVLFSWHATGSMIAADAQHWNVTEAQHAPLSSNTNDIQSRKVMEMYAWKGKPYCQIFSTVQSIKNEIFRKITQRNAESCEGDSRERPKVCFLIVFMKYAKVVRKLGPGHWKDHPTLQAPAWTLRASGKDLLHPPPLPEGHLVKLRKRAFSTPRPPHRSSPHSIVVCILQGLEEEAFSTVVFFCCCYFVFLPLLIFNVVL